MIRFSSRFDGDDNAVPSALVSILILAILTAQEFAILSYIVGALAFLPDQQLFLIMFYL